MGEAENLEKELRVGTAILEWELGDIIGHVGVRLPDNEGIAVKLLRVDQEDKYQDWMTRFDFEGNKLSGTGTKPSAPQRPLLGPLAERETIGKWSRAFRTLGAGV